MIRILPTPRILLFGLFVSAGMAVGGWAQSLSSLAEYKDYRSAGTSSTDKTGRNHDFVRIGPGETAVLADLKGPACVTHIWCTWSYPARGGLRKLVLRAWFDDSDTPCIESPLGDFFGLGNALTYTYASASLAVGTEGGLNCYFPMPFSHHARFTLTNEGPEVCRAFYYAFDYERYDRPKPNLAYFHAQYRQAMPCVKGKPYTILEATGRGHYVGCNLSVEQREKGWWGEGDDLFFIDGETSPSIQGTGSEDYFNGAWCYRNEFAFPEFGMPFRGRVLPDGTMDRYSSGLRLEDAKQWQWPVAWRKGDLWNVYRYHLESPVVFQHSIRVALEHGSTDNERQDNYSSVAYWYQSLPNGPQPPLPSWCDRMPDFLRLQDRGNGLYEAEDFIDEAETTSGTLTEPGTLFWGKGTFSRDAMLEWTPRRFGDTLTLPIPVPKTGRYELLVMGVQTRSSGIFNVAFNGRMVRRDFDLFHDSLIPGRELYGFGAFDLDPGTARLTFTYRGKDEKSEGRHLSLDTIQLRPEPEREPSTGQEERAEKGSPKAAPGTAVYELQESANSSRRGSFALAGTASRSR